MKVFLLISSILIFSFGCSSVANRENLSDRMSLVIGTIHKEHLKEKTYPIQALKAIIEIYKPDLILLEIRPEKLSSGELEDGPFEMTYLKIVAQQMGIEVAGIDYWTEEQLQKELGEKPDRERDQAFQKEFDKIEKAPQGPDLFESIHSPAKRAEHARITNLRKLIYSGNPGWNERQSWFHYNADQRLQRGQYKRVLAFVGYEHRLELSDFLADIGYWAQDPIKFAPTPRLSGLELCVPEDVLKIWSAGDQRLFNQVKSLREPLKSRIKLKAEYFESAVMKFKDKVCK